MYSTRVFIRQMKVYSFQFKQATNCFGRQRVALCGTQK
jgi:hypothetical protein